MPIQVIWDNPEKAVIRQIFEGKWDLNDYHHSLDEIEQLCRQVNHRVHLIGDLTASTGMPPNLFTLMNHVIRLMQQYWDMVVVTHANPYYKAILKVVEQLSPLIAYRIRYADSLDEAYSIIKKANEKHS